MITSLANWKGFLQTEYSFYLITINDGKYMINDVITINDGKYMINDVVTINDGKYMIIDIVIINVTMISCPIYTMYTLLIITIVTWHSEYQTEY